MAELEDLLSGDNIENYAGTGLGWLVSAGLAPAAWTAKGLTTLQALPIAAWAFIVTHGLMIQFNPLTSFQRYGLFRPGYNRAGNSIPAGVVEAEAVLGVNPEIVEQITGHYVWVPLYRAVQIPHTSGGPLLSHWAVFSDSLVYDTSGRRVDPSDNLPVAQYIAVDPVVWVESHNCGWALVRSYCFHRYNDSGDNIGVQSSLSPVEYPGDFNGSSVSRMQALRDAIGYGLAVSYPALEDPVPSGVGHGGTWVVGGSPSKPGAAPGFRADVGISRGGLAVSLLMMLAGLVLRKQ